MEYKEKRFLRTRDGAAEIAPDELLVGEQPIGEWTDVSPDGETTVKLFPATLRGERVWLRSSSDERVIKFNKGFEALLRRGLADALFK